MVVRNLSTEIYQGNRRDLIFTVRDEGGSSAKDITGMTATFAISRTNDEGVPLKTPVVDHSSSDASPQVVITDYVNGIVEVAILQADTENLAAGEYYFELELTDVSSNSVVVATGTLTVYTNVNNA